jgi:integrase
MGKKRTGVRKGSANSIVITFTYQGRQCRPRIWGQPTEANLKAATKFRARVLDAIEDGTFDYLTTFPNDKQRFLFAPTSSVKLKQYLTEWFDDHKSIYAASTLKKNQNIIDNQLIPAFGKYPISELKYIHIKKWFKKQNITNKTLSNKLTLLNQALNEAVEDELILVNPLFGKHPKGRLGDSKEEDIDPFSSKEVSEILNHCEGQQHNLFHFAFSTGLRTSEYVALTWNDIDWKNQKVSVTKAKTAEDKVAGYPKTAASNRKVKLLDDVIETLKDQKQYTYLEGKEIFHNPYTNKPWIGDKPIRNHWTTILRRAGVTYRYPYQTRHTFATLAATAGEPIGWISKQMGHVSAAFTYKTYAGWIDEDAPEAGNKFASILKQKPTIISPLKKVEK